MCTIITTFSFIMSVNGFWDSGHMLIGEIASQYMLAQDIVTLNAVLAVWNPAFPNTGDIVSATVWADTLKCTDDQQLFCPSPLQPSLDGLSGHHGTFLQTNVSSELYPELSDFDTAHGNAHGILESGLRTFVSTNCTWTSNFVLRFLLHSFGDIHQPLHTILAQWPRREDDWGGKQVRFEPPCAYADLHALWDGIDAEFVRFWSPTHNATLREELRTQGLYIRRTFPLTEEMQRRFEFPSIETMPYTEFVHWSQDQKLFRQVILESNALAKSHVYTSEYAAEKEYYRCPSSRYLEQVRQMGWQQIHLAGFRMSFLLSQIARQIQTLDLLH